MIYAGTIGPPVVFAQEHLKYEIVRFDGWRGESTKNVYRALEELERELRAAPGVEIRKIVDYGGFVHGHGWSVGWEIPDITTLPDAPHRPSAEYTPDPIVYDEQGRRVHLINHDGKRYEYHEERLQPGPITFDFLDEIRADAYERMLNMRLFHNVPTIANDSGTIVFGYPRL